MLKDPADRAPTPYEVLTLSFEPSRDQVQKALVTFMRDRRNLPRLAQAREAMQRLQSGKARAAVDLWMYDVEAPAEAVAAVPPEPPGTEPYRGVPVYPPEDLFCDLDAADVERDFRAIEPIVIRLSDIPSLDGLDAVGFRPPFDR